jgi:hypothetical protein
MEATTAKVHWPEMGKPKTEPWFTGGLSQTALAMQYEDLQIEEDPRYVEVTEEFDRLSRNATFARARLILQIHDEKLFGPWGTFENTIIARLKITARYACYLIDALKIHDLLEEAGCQPLPTEERQCRPLKYLKRDDLKILAWTRACAHKHGSAPDGPDVWREVRRLLGAIPREESDKAYRAYRKLLESAASQYRKAHQLLEEGEMEGFLAADDKRSKQQRKRLVGLLEKLTATLEGDALALQGIQEMEADQETKVSFAMFVLRSTNHSLLPYGMPITRFTDVLPDYLASAA